MKNSKMVGKSDIITKATVSFLFSFTPSRWIFSSNNSFTRFLITRKLSISISMRLMFITANIKTFPYLGIGLMSPTSLYSITENIISSSNTTVARNLSLKVLSLKSIDKFKFIGICRETKRRK